MNNTCDAPVVPRVYLLNTKERIVAIIWGLLGPTICWGLSVLAILFEQPVAYQVALISVSIFYSLGFFYVVGIAGHWWGCSYVVDDDSILVKYPGGKSISKKWSELQSVERSATIVFRFFDGTSIEIGSGYSFAKALVDDLCNVSRKHDVLKQVCD